MWLGRGEGGGSAWGRGAVGAMMEASRGEMCGGGVPLPTKAGYGKGTVPLHSPLLNNFFLNF